MTDYRSELLHLMESTVRDRIHWTYEFARPMPVPEHWAPGQHVVGDCSKGVQYLCKWAGTTDPMKMQFGLWGNSTTLATVLQHLDNPRDLLVGDIVTFGIGGTEHAAMVKTIGNDPLLWSFGHQGAPNEYTLSQDKRPQQYLRNPVPVYVPTGKDKLKKKMGYWSWLQWYIGEGDWAHYPPKTKEVRPNVPRVIPINWWYMERRFMANRHKGNPVGTNK